MRAEQHLSISRADEHGTVLQVCSCAISVACNVICVRTIGTACVLQ